MKMDRNEVLCVLGINGPGGDRYLRPVFWDGKAVCMAFHGHVVIRLERINSNHGALLIDMTAVMWREPMRVLIRI
jgi:hypothetical protein